MKNISPKTVHPDYGTFEKLAKKGNIVPVYREILADLETPVSAFMKLAAHRPYACLLESVEGGERWGRYSFISWNPRLVFASKGSSFSIEPPDKPFAWKHTDDPMGELKQLMSTFMPVETAGLPRFWGGAVGYASYDMVRFFEKLDNKPKDELSLPDSIFVLTDRIVIFDHLSHTMKLVVCVDIPQKGNLKSVYRDAQKEIDAIAGALAKPLHKLPAKPRASGAVTSNMTPERFSENIRKAKRYIHAGDIIQVVLSQRFRKKVGVASLDIYRALRVVNPSPYMYYLKLGDFEIAGSSPEILVRKEDMLCETRPIAGTRPRGATPGEEERLSRELLADPKECAEHIMLVDLGRNDLARVCVPASVHVPQLMTIEKYSHVIHITPSVKGTLKPGTDSFDLFRACFPAGTVSGAPKVRAMEIIDELEPAARGPYAGSVGYFSYSGNMDMAITIRTIVLKNKTAFVQAG